MKLLKKSLLLLWRAWFYVFFFISLLIMLPLLFLFTFRQRDYPLLYKVIRTFSKCLLFFMGFRLKVTTEQAIDRNQSYMFCSNHTSMLDPFVLIATVKNPIVFVGKAELSKIPIFGYFYKRICILVDRNNINSRKKVYLRAKNRLKKGVSLAIFPEGLVPEENIVLSPFKKGAFSLAVEQQIPIVPATYFDCKRLFSWDYLKGGPGVLRIKQHTFFETSELDKNAVNQLKEKTFDLIYSELVNDQLYMKDTNRIENQKNQN